MEKTIEPYSVQSTLPSVRSPSRLLSPNGDGFPPPRTSNTPDGGYFLSPSREILRLTPYLQETIRSNYLQLADSLKPEEVSSTIVELELRMGYFDQEDFVSQLTRVEYLELLDYCESSMLLLGSGRSEVYSSRASRTTPFKRLRKIVSYSESGVDSAQTSEIGSKEEVHTLYQEKVKYKDLYYDLPDLGLRVAFATEKAYEGGVEELHSFEKVPHRFRERKSFAPNKQSPFQIDLSITKTIIKIDGREEEEFAYECEIEYVGAEGTITTEHVYELSRLFTQLYRVRLSTELYYTLPEKLEVIHTFNNLLRRAADYLEPAQTELVSLERYRGRKNDQLRWKGLTEGKEKGYFWPAMDRDFLNEARNLHYSDMVYGGLVGNTRNVYYMTPKADGLRRLCLCINTNLYLLSTPSTVSLLAMGLSPKEVPTFLIEGELMTAAEARAVGFPSPRWLISSDCLYYRDEYTNGGEYGWEIQKQPYTTRREMCIKARKALNRALAEQANRVGNSSQSLFMTVKILLRCLTPGEFYKQTYSLLTAMSYYGTSTSLSYISQIQDREIYLSDLEDVRITNEALYDLLTEKFIDTFLDKGPKIPPILYKTDGLIFIPNSSPYLTSSEYSYRPKERGSLVSKPAVCKWKDPSELTMDFILERNSKGEIELYSTRRTSTSTKQNPVYERVLFREVPLAPPEVWASIPSKSIVETRYIDGLIYPKQLRKYKESPNGTYIIHDLLKLIQKPITVDTIQGMDLSLVRSYHNRVKSRLLEERVGSTTPLEKAILLDLGSGMGGDIRKWYKYGKVIAVEPNEEYLTELERRIREFSSDKYSIVCIPRGKRENMFTSDLSSYTNYSKPPNVQTIYTMLGRGEDYEGITTFIDRNVGAKPNYISCMFSLTFFWQSPEILEGLMKTIQYNLQKYGYFIYATMDGEVVSNLMRPNFSGQLGYGVEYTLGPLREVLDPEASTDVQKH